MWSWFLSCCWRLSAGARSADLADEDSDFNHFTGWEEALEFQARATLGSHVVCGSKAVNAHHPVETPAGVEEPCNKQTLGAPLGVSAEDSGVESARGEKLRQLLSRTKKKQLKRSSQQLAKLNRKACDFCEDTPQQKPAQKFRKRPVKLHHRRQEISTSGARGEDEGSASSTLVEGHLDGPAIDPIEPNEAGKELEQLLDPTTLLWGLPIVPLAALELGDELARGTYGALRPIRTNLTTQFNEPELVVKLFELPRSTKALRDEALAWNQGLDAGANAMHLQPLLSGVVRTSATGVDTLCGFITPLAVHGDLGEYLWRSRVLDQLQQCEAALQLVDGVDEMHARGVLHLDLKPENVLLHDLDRETAALRRFPYLLKICDFGGAAPMNYPWEPTTLVGTYGYVAPEFLVAPGTVGPAADVWSLGTIFWDLANGCRRRLVIEPPGPPPPLEQQIEDAMQQLPSRYPDVRRKGMRMGMAPDWVWVIDACRQMNAEDRPRLQQLRQMLESVQTAAFRELADS